MADSNNEGKALDAVLRFIEARDNDLRENDGWSPDDPKNPDPDPLRRVDYVCTVGRLLYAFEHTRIEPFPNQIRLADQNKKLFDPVSERFDHRADQEVWDLYFSVEASAGLTANDVARVQDALIKWVEANVACIPVVPRYGRCADSLSWQEIAGVPFRFSLRRTISQVRSSALEGRFFLRPIAPANLEQQRAARLETASERKSPKLAKWKRDSGARTVLVLEEDDLSQTNHFLVADALLPAEATSPDAPDEVFLVSTGIDQTWWVICLRGPGVVDDEPMPHREFDPMKLVKLTPR
jgi:hypothetical protein